MTMQETPKTKQDQDGHNQQEDLFQYINGDKIQRKNQCGGWKI